MRACCSSKRMRSAEAWMSWVCWRPLRRIPSSVVAAEAVCPAQSRALCSDRGAGEAGAVSGVRRLKRVSTLWRTTRPSRSDSVSAAWRRSSSAMACAARFSLSAFAPAPVPRERRSMIFFWCKSSFCASSFSCFSRLFSSLTLACIWIFCLMFACPTSATLSAVNLALSFSRLLALAESAACSVESLSRPSVASSSLPCDSRSLIRISSIALRQRSRSIWELSSSACIDANFDRPLVGVFFAPFIAWSSATVEW
mmetsp:Transcript_66627/g.158944  ORF Transcript_66627/g.158944 Transcript_66627/m.158944 type:complete len:254 (+) Transcript_66627:454-1215(+)